MQDPNADTEWNDVLRAKGILPPKEAEVTEEQIADLVEQTIKQKTQDKAIEDMTLDELEALEDEEDERILLQYRKRDLTATLAEMNEQQRLSEMKQFQEKAKFGDVREITAVDYVDEVNKAGKGVWVILHLYKTGIPLCALINQHLQSIARKFPTTKFLKSISTTCIPNYPDKNLPTIFIYFEDSMRKQIIGPHAFGGMNLTTEELEWMLSEVGAVQTDLEEDPRKKRQIKDVMTMALKDSDDEDD